MSNKKISVKRKIAIGIVLYNPENLQRFFDCLSHIVSQNRDIYIFDNSTKTYEYKFPEYITYYYT